MFFSRTVFIYFYDSFRQRQRREDVYSFFHLSIQSCVVSAASLHVISYLEENKWKRNGRNGMKQEQTHAETTQTP